MPAPVKREPSLFDVMEIAEDAADPATCPHRHEVETETDWGPPYGKRNTATCVACGHVRGRCGRLKRGA